MQNRFSLAKKMTLASLAIMAAAFAYFYFKSFTPPIFGANSIATLEFLNVNGDRQALLIRGQDRRNPVLLFLHGGPGMPAMFLAHAFQRDLEQDFVIVHWDQRASGKSWKPGIPPESISTSQLLDDLDVVVDHLLKRFSRNKIIVVGHSHGSYLGVIYASQHPSRLTAYIGIGQVVDEGRAIDLQDDFLRSKLSDMGYPPETEIGPANRETLLFESHSELLAHDSFVPLLLNGLLATEYSLRDAFNVPKGSNFSSTHMKRDVIDGPLMNSVKRLEIPVVMVMGAHDMVTPTVLAREYFDELRAPIKELYIFEHSAHFPFYEEPARFTGLLRSLKNILAERSLGPIPGEPEVGS